MGQLRQSRFRVGWNSKTTLSILTAVCVWRCFHEEDLYPTFRRAFFLLGSFCLAYQCIGVIIDCIDWSIYGRKAVDTQSFVAEISEATGARRSWIFLIYVSSRIVVLKLKFCLDIITILCFKISRSL